MANQAAIAVERVMRLAFYVAQKKSFTLEQAVTDVPGYLDEHEYYGNNKKRTETIRKKFRRDIEEIEDRFGIEVGYKEDSYKIKASFLEPVEGRALLAALAFVDVQGIKSDHLDLTHLGRPVDSSGRSIIFSVHEHLSAIRAAIDAKHRIKFDYRGVERVLEPWLIGVWRNNWYVIGYDPLAQDRRRFRLDRIDASDDVAITIVLDQTFELPVDIWEHDHLHLDPNVWGADPPLTALIAVHLDHLRRFEDDLGGTQVHLPETDHNGWPQYELVVRDYESFRDRILRFGTHLKVMDPPELVKLITSWLESIEVAI